MVTLLVIHIVILYWIRVYMSYFEDVRITRWKFCKITRTNRPTGRFIITNIIVKEFIKYTSRLLMFIYLLLLVVIVVVESNQKW
jgi:hypothetical protein